LERLGKHRLRLTDGERRRLAKLGKGLGRRALQQVAPIATPRAWVSVAGFAALALATGCAHHRVGRPPSESEIAEINQSTGADRVSLTSTAKSQT
jgi:hypothetical protein